MQGAKPSQAPVANSDAWSIGHGLTLQGVNILDNDSYGSAMPAIDFTQPSQGSLSIDSAGNLTYAAPGNYAGAVVVNYTLAEQVAMPRSWHVTLVLSGNVEAVSTG